MLEQSFITPRRMTFVLEAMVREQLTLFVIMDHLGIGLPIYSNCPDPLLAEMFETQQLIFFEFLAHAIFTVYWPMHYIHLF